MGFHFLSFLRCLELQIVVKVYSKDKTKAKQVRVYMSERLKDHLIRTVLKFFGCYFRPVPFSLPLGLHFCYS
jgi:hypothetical protein